MLYERTALSKKKKNVGWAKAKAVPINNAKPCGSKLWRGDIMKLDVMTIKRTGM